jgi:hypothetical protein
VPAQSLINKGMRNNELLFNFFGFGLSGLGFEKRIPDDFQFLSESVTHQQESKGAALTGKNQFTRFNV